VHGERAKALDFWCCDTQITPTQLALKKKNGKRPPIKGRKMKSEVTCSHVNNSRFKQLLNETT
jgi:hypothetical protein